MRDLFEKLLDGSDLSEGEAHRLVDELVDPDAEPLLAGAVLTALRAKGETADELRGFAVRLRELAMRPPFEPDLVAVDVVGTGGDGSGSLNLSTGSALVVAAAGEPVVKHGNRSVSSQSGSADVLTALGIEIPQDGESAVALFGRAGFTFLFAPAYHPAMKAVAPVRRALGIRTIFNLVGPLANPATPPYSVIGAYSADMARIMAETLAGMPSRRAFVVHGAPGWDEATPVGPYLLLDVTPDRVVEAVEDPADFGIERCDSDDLAGADPHYNAAQLRRALAGEPGPHLDALVLGASLAMRVMGTDRDEALATARSTVMDGSALRYLESLREPVHV